MTTLFNYTKEEQTIAQSLNATRKAIILEIKAILEKSGTKPQNVFEHDESLEIHFPQEKELFYNTFHIALEQGGTACIIIRGSSLKDFHENALPHCVFEHVPADVLAKIDNELLALFKKDSKPIIVKLSSYDRAVRSYAD